MNETETLWLTESGLEELGAFLCGAFTEAEHKFSFAPDVLRWKYLDPSGFGGASRSLLVKENGRIVANIGLHFTAFGDVSAVYPYDWIASGTKSPRGLLLLLRMQRMAEVQYVLGCTAVAAQVYERSGYRVVTVVPLFQKILGSVAWRYLHARQPLWRKAILLALDRGRSVWNPGRAPRYNVELRRVSVFGAELTDITQRAPATIHSRRDPQLLNHYLRYPSGTIRGWHVFHNNQLRGFALTNVIQRSSVRIGKILDCYLDTNETEFWAAAIFQLVNELRKSGCQHVMAYGSAPWMAGALRANGFFERGHTPLQWRDAKNRITLDKPFHLTHLEADIGLM